MDARWFDALRRRLTGARSRRGALASLLVGPFGLVGLPQTEARKKNKKKPCPPCKRRKKGKCKGKLPDGRACPNGTCRGGTCVANHCAEACATGCCSIEGACQPGDAAAACGAFGGACQNCAAQDQVCVSGQCQPEQTCIPGSCPECQGCNDIGSTCEANPATAGTPCSGVTCGSGTVGVCVSGACQCQPEQTCVDGECATCWNCNDTRSACQIDQSMAGTSCTGAPCAGGAMRLCISGQCQCEDAA